MVLGFFASTPISDHVVILENVFVCWITQIYVTKITVNKMFVGLCALGAWHIFDPHGLLRGIGYTTPTTTTKGV